MSPTLLSIHPVLGALDVPRSITFFASLGFTTRFVDDPTNPRYAAVARDAVEVHLQWMETVPITPDGDCPVVRILVDDVDALYDDLGQVAAMTDQRRASPFARPTHAPWGTREWHIHDPSGNSLQFYQSSPS